MSENSLYMNAIHVNFKPIITNRRTTFHPKSSNAKWPSHMWYRFDC